MNDSYDDSIDNSNDDSGDDLNLQDLWQKTPPVNVDDLVKSVKSAHRRMRNYAYFEIATSMVGLIFLVWLIKEKMFGDDWWIPVALVLFIFIGQIWMFTWRRGVWNALAKSPAELFQLKRRHFLLDLKIARSTYIGIVVGGLVGSIAAYFDGSERPFELSDLARGSILTLIAVAAVYFFVWGIRKEIKTRKKLAELEKQIKEYENFESL